MGKRFDARRPGLKELRCALEDCGKVYWVFPSSTDKTCSTTHGNRLKRGPVSTQNPFKLRVLDVMDERGLNYTVVGRRVGVSGECISRWIGNEDAAIGRQTLEGLAAFVGISPEQALKDAGGSSASDHRREAALRNLTTVPKPGTKAFRATHEKIGLALKGRRRPRELVARMMAARAATGAHERTAVRMKALNKSIKMYITHAFFGRRRWNDPTPAELQRWIRDISRAASRKYTTHSVTQTLVTSYLRPYLKRYGLRVLIGRPRSDTQRWLEIDRLMATWRRDQDGGLTDGFWNAALARIQQLEGKKAPASKESLRRTWIRHRPAALN